jgi:hypothetical protein|nr:MAG TPA: Nucleotide modification associated domain 1 [Caudoviricetes sp.]
MKYYRKQPVEAIQWNGDDQMEVSDFIQKVTRTFATKDDGYGNLNVCYMDSKKRKHQAVIPKFGWVVIEGKVLQFYKDETFKKTFKAAEEEDKGGIDLEAMTNTINKAFDGFDDLFKGFHGIPKEDIQKADYEQAKMRKNPFYVPSNEDVCKDNDKKWEDALKRKADNVCDNVLRVKAANGKCTESDTFDSVLDEMKDLHAKKNSDYGDAAHVNFLKYGPVASLSRLSEKMQRAEHIFLSGKCKVKDEPLTATLIDMAITSAMLYMELKNKGNEQD